MEDHCHSNGETPNSNNLQIIRYSPFHPSTKFSSPWFDLRVFYVRFSNFQVDSFTPEFLNLNHIPLTPDTLLESNGSRSSMYSETVPSVLRRDRVDKKSEEATFVSTDSIRTTGSIKFEVLDKDDLILSGILEMSDNSKRWTMSCEATVTACSSFFKGKHIAGIELPTIEVYIAGCFSGTPIILTKSLQLSYRKKHVRKGMLDTIPENETTEPAKSVSPKYDQQIVEYTSYKPENEEDYSSVYWRRTETMDDEGGELSWFNAGVRVGVGIGLGMCLGIGIGVGLLVRTYQSATQNFRRRLL